MATDEAQHRDLRAPKSGASVAPSKSSRSGSGAAGARIAAIEDSLAAMEASLRQSDSEIDDIQVRLAAEKKPWHRDASTVIAFAALVLSILAGAYSTYQARIIRTEERGRELRDVIQRIGGLATDIAELQRSSLDDTTKANLTGVMQAQSALLASHGTNIARSIPDMISAQEVLLLATALEGAGQWHESFDLMSQFQHLGREYNSASSFVRKLANALFIIGDPERGRQYLASMDEVLQRYKPPTPWYTRSILAQSELSWAQLEMGSGECDEARRHLQGARDVLAAEQYVEESRDLLIVNMITAVAAQVEACRPGFGPLLVPAVAPTPPPANATPHALHVTRSETPPA